MKISVSTDAWIKIISLYETLTIGAQWAALFAANSQEIDADSQTEGALRIKNPTELPMERTTTWNILKPFPSEPIRTSTRKPKKLQGELPNLHLAPTAIDTSELKMDPFAAIGRSLVIITVHVYREHVQREREICIEMSVNSVYMYLWYMVMHIYLWQMCTYISRDHGKYKCCRTAS